MKIRTDFVTNSSSSSFVAVNVSSAILDSYLADNELVDIFEQITYPYVEWRALEAELERSFALSLCALLKKFLEDMEFGDYDSEIDTDKVEDLIEFIKNNKAIIDAQATGDIELRASDSEDGFAYVQRLEYSDNHGKLTKWPCADGWDMQGYDKIQEFNLRMIDGEVEELAGLAYDAIWDIIWDDESLSTAIEKTGVTEEFDLSQIDADDAEDSDDE